MGQFEGIYNVNINLVLDEGGLEGTILVESSLETLQSQCLLHYGPMV